MAEEDLIYTYRLQLTEGCISFHCNHIQCKSCPNYIFSSETTESLHEKAISFAKNHQHENLLCPNFPPTLYDYAIFDNVLIFNDFLDKFNKNINPQNPEKIIEIISDTNTYPFLFSYDLNELDFYSIHPPLELIKNFIVAQKNNPIYLKFLEQSLFDRIYALISSSAEFNSLYHLRAIYISFLFFKSLSQNENLLIDLICHLMSLLPDAHHLLATMISKTPLLIPQLNDIIQDILTNFSKSKKAKKKVNKQIWDLAKFIHFILVPANNESGSPYPYSLFANQALSELYSPKRELRRFVSSTPTLLHTPSVLTLLMKSSLIPEGNIITSSTHVCLPPINSAFKFEDFEIHKKQNSGVKQTIPYKKSKRKLQSNNNEEEDEDEEEEEDFFDILPFGNQEFNSRDDDNDEYDIYQDGSDDISMISHSSTVIRRRLSKFRIRIRRSRILDDTLLALLRADPIELAGQLRVEYEGEAGIDLGGISRDFFSTVTNMIFSPDFAMFKLINDRFYWFVPGENTQPLNLYTMLGSFIGVAINNKIVLPIRFPNILYKKLANYNNCHFNIDDYAEIDPVAAQSLKSLLESKEQGENIELAGLMFDSSEDYFGSIRVDELIENGSNIAVTNENVEDYVEKLIDWKLNKSIEKVFGAFKTGYLKANNTPLMRLFAPEELSELVSGVQDLDWKAFKEAAIIKDYNKDSQTIKDLWSIFDNDWNEDQRIAFLYYITGIKTAPVGGLGRLSIKITREDKTDYVPMAHTCYYHLVLPDYKNRDKLKNKLEICLSNTEGFGLL